MKRKVFLTVREGQEKNRHIATLAVLRATPQHIINDKLKTACEEHFDSDVEIREDVILDKCTRGNIGIIHIEVSNETQIFTTTVEVQETWLY